MFKGKTVIERISRTEYKLKSSLTFETDKVKVTSKSGLITDGATIPKLFWSIIGCPMSGNFIGSAIIHDGLYGSHKISRQESDYLFLVMLKNNEVGLCRRYIMYYAVRLFGGYIWRKHTKEDIAICSKFVEVKLK